jgi:electron transport complex protein RnfC
MLIMFKKFRGGIHPHDHKELTAEKAIQILPAPAKVIISLRQHIGAPCSPVVAKGDKVKTGQLIASSDAFVSSPIHASVSGTVSDIGEYPHPVFGKCMSIVIDNDGEDKWVEGLPLHRDWNSLSVNEMNTIIRDCGIVGMGGATFPAHVKLAPPKDKNVHTFILNGAECEPYLTSDYRLMLECADDIVEGVKITMKVLGVDKGYVGIEDNKPEAVKAMEKAFAGTNVEVAALPTRYPQGGEKMLIKAITGNEVPSGALPADVGVVVHNVGTVIAIAEAVVKGIPLVERVTTVTGGAVHNPKNLLIRIGTTFEDAVRFCGGYKTAPKKIIMGGPMMGFAQSSAAVPVLKGVSGILVLGKEDVNSGREEACIRCGSCVEACPMGLNPSMLSILGERRLFVEAKEKYNLLDCIECGSCVYGCPAKRNIVQYVKNCKALNMAQAAKNSASR